VKKRGLAQPAGILRGIGRLCQQRHRICLAQTRQRERSDVCLPPQTVEHGNQVGIGGDAFPSQGENERNGNPGDVAGQIMKALECGRISPVNVLDNQQQFVLACLLGEEAEDGLE